MLKPPIDTSPTVALPPPAAEADTDTENSAPPESPTLTSTRPTETLPTVAPPLPSLWAVTKPSPNTSACVPEPPTSVTSPTDTLPPVADPEPRTASAGWLTTKMAQTLAPPVQPNVPTVA